MSRTVATSHLTAGLTTGLTSGLTTGVTSGLTAARSGLGVFPLVDLNPMHWLGDAAKEGVADGFTAMMMALWSAALWLLQSVFGLLDQFTTPRLDEPGLAHLYSVTAGASVAVALIVALGQIGLTAIRRDGRPLATLAGGLAQYGAVLTIWVGVCTAVVLGCAGLTTTLLHELLDVDGFGGYAAGSGWVDHVTGTVEASVLGVCALFMLIPAALGYLVIMLAREAALVILVATMPIAAAGALSESTRVWMWKSIRWFLAACLTAPLLALVLGLGVQIGQAAIPEAAPQKDTTAHRSADSPSPHAQGSSDLHIGEIPDEAGSAAPGDGDGAGALDGPATGAQLPAAQTEAEASSGEVPDTSANVGLAVVGCVIMLVGCFCPLVLFRLLAFVDPGTGSGAAFRSTLAASGGVAGLFTRSRSETGSATSAQSLDETGRSASESSAEAATTTRYSAKAGRTMPPTGRAVGRTIGHTTAGLGGVATQGASVGLDVMGQAGVGHQGYYDTTPGGGRRPTRSGPAAGAEQSQYAHQQARQLSPDPSQEPHPASGVDSAHPSADDLGSAQASSADDHPGAGTSHQPGVPTRPGTVAHTRSQPPEEPADRAPGDSSALEGPAVEDAAFLA